MDKLDAVLAAGAALGNQRIDPRDVQAMLANPGLARYGVVTEVQVAEGVSPHVRIAPDGTVCEIRSDEGKPQQLIIGDYCVRGEITLIVDGFVPVYRVKNDDGITAVFVRGGEPMVLTKLDDVRATNTEWYVIISANGVDTLWSLHHADCEELFTAPCIIKMHGHDLVEYVRDDVYYLATHRLSTRRLLPPERKVYGRVVSAVVSSRGVLWVILKNEQNGRSIVCSRGPDDVVCVRHTTTRYCLEMHQAASLTFDGIGDLLVAGKHTVACEVRSAGHERDVLVIGLRGVALLDRDAYGLVGYPHVAVRDPKSARTVLVNADDMGQFSCDRKIQHLSRNVPVFVGEEKGQMFATWGDKMDHRVDLRVHGELDARDVMQLEYRGSYKLVFAQSVPKGQYVLTDGWVQYGKPFDELLKLKILFPDSGTVRAWVLRGAVVSYMDAVIIS